MGCHTWFYKRIETPTHESIVQAVKERISKELEFLHKIIHDRESIDHDLLEAYPEWNKEYAEKNMPFWLNLQNRLNDGSIDNEELYDYYCDWVAELTEYDEKNGWFEEAEYHDLFRKYGYPEDRLFSLEETLNYIKNPENNCSIYEGTEDRLREFWAKYPDGMIQFG